MTKQDRETLSSKIIRIGVILAVTALLAAIQYIVSAQSLYSVL
ncbi:hypothetical protein [Rhizobium sp. 21-4511-3d]